MRTYERSDVTVDQCTECRGIFLDRGELERLMDAETAWAARQPNAHRQAPPPPPDTRAPYPHPDYRDQEEYDQRHKGPYKERRSFLDDLFGALLTAGSAYVLGSLAPVLDDTRRCENLRLSAPQRYNGWPRRKWPKCGTVKATVPRSAE